MSFAEARDGTRIYYHDWGTGPAVVLVHGWPLNADSWERQHMALAEAGLRVVAYDRRGFGRSDKPWSGYDYDTMSDDLGAVVDACGLSDVALVGFSMGGGEVARWPNRGGRGRVRKAAFLGAITPWLMGEGGATDDVLEGVKGGIRAGRAEFFSGFFQAFFGKGTPGVEVSDETLRWAWNMALQASPKATLACVDAWKTDFRADLAAFADIPTLVVHGDDDQIVPIDATARRMPELIPGARLVTYEGAPHGLLATHGDRVLQDLVGFLRS